MKVEDSTLAVVRALELEYVRRWAREQGTEDLLDELLASIA